MDAEREIVRVYFTLQKKPYISELNAGKRVIDFVLFEPGRAIQVEVSCSLTKKSSADEEHMLIARFEDPSVISKLNDVCKSHKFDSYEKMLITSISNVKIDGVKVVSFSEILLEVLSELDTQHYSDGTIRALQIIKHLLLSDQNSLVKLYDSKILKKKHLRLLSKLLLKYPDLLSDLSSQNKTMMLNALFEGEELPSFNDFPKQKLSKIVSILFKSAEARKMMKEGFSEQRNLKSFKK